MICHYIALGLANSHIGQYKLAIEDYTRAIQLDPDLAQAYYNRGIANGQRREYLLADADFTKACSLDSKYC